MDWVNDKEAMIKYKMPAAPEVSTFNLLAYDTKFHGTLLGNWVVQVSSQIGYDVNTEMGQQQCVKLDLNSSMPRMVKLFTSHPLIATFPPPHNDQFDL